MTKDKNTKTQVNYQPRKGTSCFENRQNRAQTRGLTNLNIGGQKSLVAAHMRRDRRWKQSNWKRNQPWGRRHNQRKHKVLAQQSKQEPSKKAPGGRQNPSHNPLLVWYEEGEKSDTTGPGILNSDVAEGGQFMKHTTGKKERSMKKPAESSGL